MPFAQLPEEQLLRGMNEKFLLLHTGAPDLAGKSKTIGYLAYWRSSAHGFCGDEQLRSAEWRASCHDWTVGFGTRARTHQLRGCRANTDEFLEQARHVRRSASRDVRRRQTIDPFASRRCT